MTFLINPFALAAPAAGGGQQLFTSSGSFVVPAGVTSVCIVAIGRGYRATGDGTYSYAGGGGALAYANNFAVTPGQTIVVTIDATGSYAVRSGTTIVNAGAATSQSGGNVVVGTGFSGGTGGYNLFGSTPVTGGGSGGYTSVGGSASYASGTGRGGAGSSPLGGAAGGAAGGAPTEDGGTYGGGSGAEISGMTGGPGCVRIIWGAGRAFPNTNTGDV